MKQKLEIVKDLKVIFGDVEQFVLTGSTIAVIQGVADKSNDIDIVLIAPSEHTLKMLDSFVSNFGKHDAKTTESLKSKGSYLFEYRGFKVDMFVNEERYDDKLQYDGIIISPLMGIVKAKQSYHRFKDFMQLKSWASRIFDYKNQDNELQSINDKINYI